MFNYDAGAFVTSTIADETIERWPQHHAASQAGGSSPQNNFHHVTTGRDSSSGSSANDMDHLLLDRDPEIRLCIPRAAQGVDNNLEAGVISYLTNFTPVPDPVQVFNKEFRQLYEQCF